MLSPRKDVRKSCSYTLGWNFTLNPLYGERVGGNQHWKCDDQNFEFNISNVYIQSYLIFITTYLTQRWQC